LSNDQSKSLDSSVDTPKIKRFAFYKKYLPRLPTQIFPCVRNKFSQFTISQWMYLIAILLLLFIVDEDIKANTDVLWAELLWVFGIAGAGLVRELWVGFIHI
jgi:hypothetical protein